MKTYGEMVRGRRKAKGWSLREAARRMGLHAGNLSKVERGLWKPPRSPKIVLRVQQGLDLERGSDIWDSLTLLAAIENGMLPGWVKENEDSLKDLATYIWKKRS